MSPPSNAPCLHLFSTIGIEGVVHDELSGQNLVIILEAEMPEALCNGFEPRRLRPVVKVLRHIRAVYDLGQKQDGGIFDAVLRDDGLEATFALVMTQLDVRDIKRNGHHTLRHGKH